jgi:hypothetical protein
MFFLLSSMFFAFCAGSDFCIEYQEPLLHELRAPLELDLGTVPAACGTCNPLVLDMDATPSSFSVDIPCGCTNVTWGSGDEPAHAQTPPFTATLSLVGDLTDCSVCLSMPPGVKVDVDVDVPVWLHLGDGWWGSILHSDGTKLVTHVGPGAVELDYVSQGELEDTIIITDAQVTSLTTAAWDLYRGDDVVTITGETTTVSAKLEPDRHSFTLRVGGGASVTGTLNLQGNVVADVVFGGGSSFVGSLATAGSYGSRLRVWEGATFTGNVAMTGGRDSLEMQDGTITGNINTEGNYDSAYLVRSTIGGTLDLGSSTSHAWIFESTIHHLQGSSSNDYFYIHDTTINTVALDGNSDFVHLRNATLPGGIVGNSGSDRVYRYCGDTDISPLDVEYKYSTCSLSEGSSFPCPCAPACVPVPPPPPNFECSGPDALVCSLCGEVVELDVVFVVDASGSMTDNIRAVGRGLSSFVRGLQSRDVTPRYSLVLTGLAPELVIDFTDDIDVMIEVFARVEPNTVFPDVHDRHNDNEATLEAIRMAYGAAPQSTFPAPYAHVYTPNNTRVSGNLVWRPYARRLVIICTDEDSDRPYLSENKAIYPGMSSTNPPSTWTYTQDPNDSSGAWASELADTMDVLTAWSDQVPILPKTAVYGFCNPGNGKSKQQFGDTSCDTATGADGFSGFDADATLACLVEKGYADSLEGKMLAAGLSSRMFDIRLLDDPEEAQSVVENFFDEVVRNVASCNAKKRKRSEPDEVERVGKRQAPSQPECFDYLCDVFIGCYTTPRCDDGCFQCTIDGKCYADQEPNPDDGCSICLGEEDTEGFSACGADDDLYQCRLSECQDDECVRIDVCTQGCDMCCIGGDAADVADGICDTGTCHARGDVGPVVDLDPSCVVCVPSIDAYDWTVDLECMDTHHPACDDGRRNGGETGPDCGGPECGPCSLGESCTDDSDCGLGFHCYQEECTIVTASPTSAPTAAPTPHPTPLPTASPTLQPTTNPTVAPTPNPTLHQLSTPAPPDAIETPAPPAPTAATGGDDGEGEGGGNGGGDGGADDDDGDSDDDNDGDDSDGEGESGGGGDALASVVDTDEGGSDSGPLSQGLTIGLIVGGAVLFVALVTACVLRRRSKGKNAPKRVDTFASMDYAE